MRTSVFRPAAVVVAGGALLVAGCTSSGPGASPSSSAPVSAITSSQAASHAPTTITVWTLQHAAARGSRLQAALGQLHATYPWLTVKFVPGKDDAAFAKAVAAGSPAGRLRLRHPGQRRKVLLQRHRRTTGPYLKAARWMSPRRSRPRRWCTPSTPASSARCRLLADAYALFYNKKMFADAGITAPPKTMSELTADAKKLTIRNGATIKTFGFVPRSDYNNNSSIYVGSQSGTKYYDSSGKATFASDGKWAKLLEWDKSLNDYYGGRASRSSSAPTTGTPTTPTTRLLSGAVAMEVDGEWHVGEIDGRRTRALDYGDRARTDDRRVRRARTAWATPWAPSAYIPSGSKNKEAAFFALQQLTTDTEFLTTLADTVFNIPSTFDSLKAWDKADDPHWAPLVKHLPEPGLVLQGAHPRR